MIHSYPTIYKISHRAVSNLFDGEVVLQEKIDGSQISFGLLDGVLEARSRNQQLILDAPGQMFTRAVEAIMGLDLHPGWVYRAEYLSSPKHNTIAYSRIPAKHLILYDICSGLEEYLPYEEVVKEGQRLGLEVVPQFYKGEVKDPAFFKEFLDRTSILGGSKIEGIVVKNYARFTQEKKVAMGKYVREGFEEENSKDWRARNPTAKDVTQELILRYKTEARWRKAVQHLKERGMLAGAPQDIGMLIQEVPEDVLKECEVEIKDRLFGHFWKDIRRGITSGLAEWYKEELANQEVDSGHEPTNL